MLDSLYIAATGMHAQQLNVDTISNNLANVNTTGYKRARVSFEDTLYRELARGTPLLGAGTGSRFGAGVAVADTAKMFSDGDLKKTDGPLDVAIRGAGFFEVLMPDGSRAYTRSGTLRVNQDGSGSIIFGSEVVDFGLRQRRRTKDREGPQGEKIRVTTTTTWREKANKGVGFIDIEEVEKVEAMLRQVLDLGPPASKDVD